MSLLENYKAHSQERLNEGGLPALPLTAAQTAELVELLKADKVVDADELSWKFQHYQELADKMKQAAESLGIEIKWGGDWTTFKDGPHFELDKKIYP